MRFLGVFACRGVLGGTFHAGCDETWDNCTQSIRQELSLNFERRIRDDFSFKNLRTLL